MCSALSGTNGPGLRAKTDTHCALEMVPKHAYCHSTAILTQLPMEPNTCLLVRWYVVKWNCRNILINAKTNVYTERSLYKNHCACQTVYMSALILHRLCFENSKRNSFDKTRICIVANGVAQTLYSGLLTSYEHTDYMTCE